MEKRELGTTGLAVSVFGFGCGDVGGLLVRGTEADRARAVAMALDAGVNYFDTAPMYGKGVSEQNLGAALQHAGSDVIVGTKVRISQPDPRTIRKQIVDSLETSLQRLRRDRIDLLQLHNPLSADPNSTSDTLHVRIVLDEVLPVFDRLQVDGKIRAYGITGLGETAALQAVLEWKGLGTCQVVYNLLNDSAGRVMPVGYPAQDFGHVLDGMRERGIGALAIRVLAAGTLSGSAARHPVGLPSVEPMGSGSSYAADLRRAGRLGALVTEGHVESLVEGAIRFAISNRNVATAVVGLSSVEQVEVALAAARKGVLDEAAMLLVQRIQAEFVGENR